MEALIGHTGFIGSFLLRQRPFDRLFNSRNFAQMAGTAYDRIVCAGLPAAKWIANRHPEADMANIDALRGVLRTVEAQQFILISTVDVYPLVCGVDESTRCDAGGNSPYGRHRLIFEDFVRERFAGAVVLRLPALFGRGLKKNVIFDLLHDNCLEMINPDSSFQWYDLGRLWDDIDTAVGCGVSLANLVTEPLRTRQILDRFFPNKAVGAQAGPEVHYDIRTRHAPVFGGDGHYLMGQQDVIRRLGRYIASESAKVA